MLTSRWYGIGRSTIALATALTLAVNSTATLNAAIVPHPPACRGIASVGAFCLFRAHLEGARWLLVATLLIVASGVRPRYTGVPHWWATWSLIALPVHDGGDLAAAAITLLLIPATMLDSRPNHWHEPEHSQRTWLVPVQAQIATIYLASALAKLRVAQWRDGTAMYYFTQGSSFRIASWIHPIATLKPAAALMTWGTIALELVLAGAVFLPAPIKRRVVLPAGVAFHVLAAALFQIPSFSLVMAGALLLLLMPDTKKSPLVQEGFSRASGEA